MDNVDTMLASLPGTTADEHPARHGGGTDGDADDDTAGDADVLLHSPLAADMGMSHVDVIAFGGNPFADDPPPPQPTSPTSPSNQQAEYGDDDAASASLLPAWPTAASVASLLTSVRTQSTTLIHATRQDFREFADVLSTDAREMAAVVGGGLTYIAETVAPLPAEDAAAGDGDGRDAASETPMTDLLTGLAVSARSAIPPAASSVVGRIGSGLGRWFKAAITVVDSADEVDPGSSLPRKGSGSKRRAAGTAEQQGAESWDVRRVDPTTYTATAPSDDAFDATTHAADIADALDNVPGLRKVMTELVPVHVSYHDFWARYFFHARGTNRTAIQQLRQETSSPTSAFSPAVSSIVMVSLDESGGAARRSVEEGFELVPTEKDEDKAGGGQVSDWEEQE